MIHLAHEIITGKRTIETLTLEECLGLIERITNDEEVASFWHDVQSYEMDEYETLKYAQQGASVVLLGVEDDPEYWSTYGTY